MTGRERANRALAGERIDRPPFQLSFTAAAGRADAPWAREWPIRAGVDLIEVGDTTPWPWLRAEEVATSPAERCEALLAQPWPDPDDPGLYRSLQRLVESRPEQAIVYRMPGLYHQIESGLGFERFMEAVQRAPALAGQLTERMVTIAGSMARQAGKRGADALLLQEELAGLRGPFAPLEQLDRWIFPFDHLLLEEAVRAGTPILCWSPRADDAVWERFAALGARWAGPLQPEPAAVEAFRGRWDGRLGIYGALDSQGIIARGAPGAIRDHVQAMFAAAGPDHGLIFSASHLPLETPLGNLEALIQALRECHY